MDKGTDLGNKQEKLSGKKIRLQSLLDLYAFSVQLKLHLHTVARSSV